MSSRSTDVQLLDKAASFVVGASTICRSPAILSNGLVENSAKPEFKTFSCATSCRDLRRLKMLPSQTLKEKSTKTLLVNSKRQAARLTFPKISRYLPARNPCFNALRQCPAYESPFPIAAPFGARHSPFSDTPCVDRAKKTFEPIPCTQLQTREIASTPCSNLP